MAFNFSNFNIETSEAQQFIGAVAGVLIVAAILIVLINIVLYVLKSLGLYTIAKRRGIACAWLAWLPVGCEWITASLADQYRKVTSGKSTIRRFIIVALAVISIGLTSFTTTTVNDKTDDILELVEQAEERGEFVDEEDAMDFVGGLFEELSEIVGGGFTLIAALAGVVAFASNVYWFVCAGDVYASCCPKNGTMMLVLSIFMPILAPFFFFCNKEKDAGMVPANQPQQPAQPQFVAPVQPVYEAPVESAQPVYEASQTPVEPWAATDSRPEPWENPEN